MRIPTCTNNVINSHARRRHAPQLQGKKRSKAKHAAVECVCAQFIRDTFHHLYSHTSAANECATADIMSCDNYTRTLTQIACIRSLLTRISCADFSSLRNRAQHSRTGMHHNLSPRIMSMYMCWGSTHFRAMVFIQFAYIVNVH